MDTKKDPYGFGTRPEAIKLGPVLKALEQDNRFDSFVCVTGQHRALLDQVLDVFDIQPHYDLNIMKGGQSLSEITSNILPKLGKVLEKIDPDLILVHGDTTTSFVLMAAYYFKIPVGHIEAGLRKKIYLPWPEEETED